MQLSLEAVRIAFGSHSVLDGVDLQVRSGEMTAVIGPSGSGKTTLLSVVAGMRHPDHGHRVVALDADEPPSAGDIAWVFQTSPVLMRRTACDNVALGARANAASRSESRTRAREALELLSLGSRAGERLFRLSGGERQRVVIARGLAARAGLLIADEPTASLDPVTKDDVTSALLAAVSAGGAALVATHDADVARRCHRVLELRAGRLHPVALETI